MSGKVGNAIGNHEQLALSLGEGSWLRAALRVPRNTQSLMASARVVSKSKTVRTRRVRELPPRDTRGRFVAATPAPSWILLCVGGDRIAPAPTTEVSVETPAPSWILLCVGGDRIAPAPTSEVSTSEVAPPAPAPAPCKRPSAQIDGRACVLHADVIYRFIAFLMLFVAGYFGLHLL